VTGGYEAVSALLLSDQMFSNEQQNAVWDTVGSCPYPGWAYAGESPASACNRGIAAVESACAASANSDSGSDSGGAASPSDCCGAIQQVAIACLGAPQFDDPSFMSSLMSSSCPVYPPFVCAAAFQSTLTCVENSTANLGLCCDNAERASLFCRNYDPLSLDVYVSPTVAGIILSDAFDSACPSGSGGGRCDPSTVIPGLFWYNGQMVTTNMAQAQMDYTAPGYFAPRLAYTASNGQVFWFANPSSVPTTADGSPIGTCAAAY